MSTPSPGDKEAAPSPEELRRQVEHTREELGQTVEALAAKADVKAQAKEKAAEIKEQAAEKATLATDQIRDKAAQAAQLVKDKTPDPVLDKAAQAATQVRDAATRAGQLAAEKTPDPVREKAESAAATAKANRTPCLPRLPPSSSSCSCVAAAGAGESIQDRLHAGRPGARCHERHDRRRRLQTGVENARAPRRCPDATDEHRTWQEVLIAAALQGAIFAVVKAAVARAGAVTTRRLTGTWPG